jgi:hypothetical protein
MDAFVDVIRLGYGKVLMNAVWVGVISLAVAAAVELGGWLGKISPLTARADAGTST